MRLNASFAIRSPLRDEPIIVTLSVDTGCNWHEQKNAQAWLNRAAKEFEKQYASGLREMP